jgi:cytochrome c oxidase subunit 4
MSEHITPVRTYVWVFLALMALTLITVSVAFLHLGAFNDIVALTIAVTKACLVVLYFMHVRYSSPMTKLVVIAGVVWLIILIGLTLSDYLTRDLIRTPAAPASQASMVQ